MGKIKKVKKERADERKEDRTKERKREAILPLQVLSREDYLTAIVLSTLIFVVYAFTAAPGVTLADSADYINGVLTLGIVHPPGYPLYTLLGHLFTFLPFGDPTFRVNLFSALWGSLCLGIVFLILRMLSIGRIHALFAPLFLGFTTVYWSKTGVAEVYSFNGFLIAIIFFWILSYNRDKKKSQLYLIFLTTGLALSNHYPLVLLTGVGLVFLLDRRDLHLTDFIKGLLFLGLGLTPYLYLFIQATNPELQYNYGKISDFGMVFDHILRKSYRNIYGGTIWDKYILTLTFFKTIVTNFLLPSLFLFFGIAYTFIQKRQYRYPLIIAALSPSLGLIMILTFRSDETYMSNFLAYILPSFIILTIFLAIGLQKLMNRYVQKNIVQVSLLVVMLLLQVGYNFPSSSHHNDRLADLWGTDLLNSAKPDSILIICPGQFPIYYSQLIKGVGQGMTLYDRSSSYTRENLYQPWLLFRYRRVDQNQIRNKRERELINNSNRPIYYTCKDVLDLQGIDFTLTPFLYRADKRHSEEIDFSRYTVSVSLLDSLVNGYPKTEHWLDIRRKKIFSRLITFYGAYRRPEVNNLIDYFKRSKYFSDPGIILSIANNLYYFKNVELAKRFYERAEKLSFQAFSSTDLAVYCDVLAKERNYEKALSVCIDQEQSAAPCKPNTMATRLTIAGIYKEKGDWRKVTEYSRKIIQCQPEHKIAQRYLKVATERTN